MTTLTPLQTAEKLLEKGQDHLLIIGRAGTGKSTLLNQFREQTKRKIAVVAPTGVAALNVGGETIHSFFKLRPGSGEREVRSSARRMKGTTLRIFQELQCLIIDEISMVRADLFDQMDLFLRLVRKNSNPFGGVRVIMFGDLYQLPPVAKDEEWQELRLVYDSPYFFASQVWRQIENDLFGPQIDLVELQAVFRQKDEDFIDFLESVRNKDLNLEVLAEINRQLVDETLDLSAQEYKDAIVLTTTNRKADQINRWQMQQVEAEPVVFLGRAKGKFDAKSFPTEEELVLKRGARVMLLNNDSDKRWINGSTGWVEEVIAPQDGGAAGAASGDGPPKEPTFHLGVLVRLDDGRRVEVFPYTWEAARAVFDVSKDTIEREVLGSFTQLPIKLAWAITIHKSQGKTFDQVVIDLDRMAFATGQTYVALSRCTSLKGLKLIRPLRQEDILIDEKIIAFLNHLEFILGKSEKGAGGGAGVELGAKEGVGARIKSPRERKREQLEQALADETPVQIIYLGSGQKRQKRTITPLKIGPMTYAGQEFTAVTAWCADSQEKRLFNLDRVMEVEPN